MNATLQTIHDRRSIRNFTPKQVNDSELSQILDAAFMAPNGMNLQNWHFSVIQNSALLDRMVDAIKKYGLSSGNDFLVQRMSSATYHTFYHAPTVVLISADETAHYGQIDCGAAAQNMALAARSLNIGSCLIASSALLFASQEGKKIGAELGIPKGYAHVICVALGYIRGDTPTAPPRNKEVVTYIR